MLPTRPKKPKRPKPKEMEMVDMSNFQGRENRTQDLVLANREYAYLQDTTKGTTKVNQVKFKSLRSSKEADD